MQQRSERLSLLSRVVALGPLCVLMTSITGCGGFHWDVDPAAISSTANTIRVNQTLQLKTEIGATNTPVNFAVNGIPGGDATVGTVNASGLYTAPAVVPTPNTVMITSTVPGYPKVAPGSVTLNVLNPIPTINSTNPWIFYQGTRQLTVYGTQFVPGAQILWNGVALPTTFQQSTQLTANVPAPSPGPYTLEVDNPEPGPANSSPFTVNVNTNVVVITVQNNGPAVVRAGNTLTMPLTVTGPADSVSVTVNGIPGGNAQVGTAVAGLGSVTYTAPAVVPSPNTVTLTLANVSDPLIPPVSTTQAISVINPIPIVTSLTPGSLTEGNTTVAVNGSRFVYGAQIFWNGSPVATTYISGNQLAASIPASTPGTFPLEVDNPQPGPANGTPIPVVVGPGKVVLTLQTWSGTSVRVNNSINFPLTVTGTTNTGVTMTVNGVPNGNAQVGTVVTNSDGSITYTAPAVVPTPNNVVALTLTSVDNPTVSTTQNISVMNPVPILTAATPNNFNTGPGTVALTGSSFISGAQVLANGVPVPTTFNSSGQLTASISPTIAGNLDLQVLNPGPGPATSSDLIVLVNGTPPTPPVTPEDASRFLQQATFGATDSDIHFVSQNGYTAWLNQQFSAPQTLHEPAVEQALVVNNPPCAAGDVKCNATLFLGNGTDDKFVQQSFWQQAITGNDELRQRVKYALTEIFVVSNSNSGVSNMPRGQANYLDLLGADAFGNFRQLLQDVTLNPMMGQFLSVQGNDKGDGKRDPDENYAREVMQLFTIGLYQLNPDGTQQLDGSGNPIPTYSNKDVQGLAKVFTGFSWNIPGNQSETAWGSCCIYVGTGFGEDILQMQAYPNHHSTDEKDFLGVTIPGNGNPDPNGDLKIALDTLFNHPNLPPFFSKQMIQHLVTSNPSPAYVGRVAAVFENDGTGVRGNLQAVIQAILMDPEARTTSAAVGNPQYGKVREALIRYLEWARAFTAVSRSASFSINSTADPIYGLGQMTLESPTVFNWFAPGYVPPGTSIAQAGLVAPEMQMTDVSTVVGYLNYMQDAIGANSAHGLDIYSNYSTEIGLASTPDQLVARINLLLMAGQMDPTLQAQITSAVEAIPIPAGDQDAINAALLTRVETAIYLTMAAPSYTSQI